jgi:predicted  nucleic acid-binding Zn-ribbon protein
MTFDIVTIIGWLVLAVGGGITLGKVFQRLSSVAEKLDDMKKNNFNQKDAAALNIKIDSVAERLEKLETSGSKETIKLSGMVDEHERRLASIDKDFSTYVRNDQGQIKAQIDYMNKRLDKMENMLTGLQSSLVPAIVQAIKEVK